MNNTADWLKEILVVPETHERLKWIDNNCYTESGKRFGYLNSILSFINSSQLTGQDAKMNKMYDYLAPFYDFNERYIGRLITGVDIVKGREDIVSQLGLKKGMRLLEISPGPGVFQKLLRDKIGNESEFVSLDLSLSMLIQCKKRNNDLKIELVQADAQMLPFTSESFDAVFHFGGVNLFNNPDKAIQEFIRVTKKGGIVSWGDEGFTDDYKLNHKIRANILSKINPGFTKEIPVIPDTINDYKVHRVYKGLSYLVVGKKK